MTVSARVWFVTFAALVFVSGALAGVLMDRAWVVGAPSGRPPIGPNDGGGPGPRGEGPPIERILDDLGRTLDLRETQRADLRRILDARRPRVQRLQADTRRMFLEEQDALVNDILAVLDEPQAATFRDLMATRPGVLGPGPGRPGPGPGGRGVGRRGGRE